MRSYKCLGQQTFVDVKYKLVPIRDDDRFQIMQWRNEQIEILRQKNPLTIESQNAYFKEVISKLFEDENPSQLLFSFLENDKLIGYGGLVHIDWESKNGEISFITETSRNQVAQQLKSDWSQYLKMLKIIATIHLRFNKIYTYAYDIRPALFSMLTENDFIQEATLKNHVLIQGNLHSVLIHSYFCNSIILKEASEQDVLLYFDWVNEKIVRENSFDSRPILLDQHKRWFSNKIKDPNSLMMVAYLNQEAVGQVRFDQTDEGIYEIGFSVAKNWRGFGLGSEMIKIGVADFIKKKPNYHKIIAKVKKENEPSKKVFAKSGFTLSTAQSDTLVVYYIDSKS
jgi:RimJ/RimL family protein N-acetyltransferase